jgi:hypothetical protein
VGFTRAACSRAKLLGLMPVLDHEMVQQNSPGLKPISVNLKRDESPGGTEMIVARQFIAWNVSKEATRPVGTV